MQKLPSNRFLWLIAMIVPLVGAALVINHFRSERIAGRSAAEWSLKLVSGDAAERQAAENALRQFGGRAVPSLCRALRATEPPFKNTFYRIVRHTPEPLQGWAFRKFFSCDASTKRTMAARALWFIGPAASAAVPQLEKAMLQGDQRVPMQAANALGNLGPSAVPALIRCLQNTNQIVRQAACYGLAAAKTNATPAIHDLRVALSDTNATIRTCAAYALSCIWPPPSLELIALVDQETGLAREAAASALQRTRLPVKVVQPALLRMFSSASPGERRQAIASLGYMQPWSQEAFSAIVAALSDSDEAVRAAATNTLCQPNLRAMSSLVVLTQNLSHARPEHRLWSARVIGGFGPSAASAMPALATLSTDPDPNVRAAAAEARDAIQPPKP